MYSGDSEWIGTLTGQFSKLSYPDTDCSGKTVIVTGANRGIGAETVRHFVRLNAARVILGCRNVEKAEEVKAEIAASMAAKPAVLEVWHVDLSSFESVKEFCGRADGLDRLDVVVENAGVMVGFNYKVYEGYEQTITVNVLSTFLMALLLLPALRRTAVKCNIVPHIVLLSSNGHYFTAFPQRKADKIFDELRGDFDLMDRYDVSKLIVILVCRELAKALDAPGKPHVIINNVHPGLCNTGFWRNAPRAWLWLLDFISWLIGRSAEMGSRTLMTAAFAGDETHGQYMSDCKVSTGSKFVRSEEGHEVGKRLYDELLAILETAAPGISNNI